MENERNSISKNKVIITIAAIAVIAVIVILAMRSLFTTSLDQDEHSRSWLMIGCDAARTSYNFKETIRPPLKKKKTIDLDSGESGIVTTVFAADEKNLYSLSYLKSIENKEGKNKITAVGIEDGEKKWEFSETMLGLGAIENDRLFCVSAKPNKIFAVDVSNGKQVWESQLVKEAMGRQLYTPVVRDSIVYVVSEGGKLLALDTKTGKKKWTYSKALIVGTPAVSEGYVYCLTQDKKVLALDARSGDQSWIVGAPEWEALMNPVVANRQIYIIDRNRDKATDSLMALDARTGDLLWQFKIEKNTITNGMCIGEDKLFLSLGEFKKAAQKSKSQGEVLAINTENGKKLWKKEVWGMPSYLVAAGDTVYVSSSKIWRDIAGHLEAEGGSVIAMSMKSGEVLEEYKVIGKEQKGDTKSLQPPALLSNGSLFLQNVLDNTIHIYSH